MNPIENQGRYRKLQRLEVICYKKDLKDTCSDMITTYLLARQQPLNQ